MVRPEKERIGQRDDGGKRQIKFEKRWSSQNLRSSRSARLVPEDHKRLDLEWHGFQRQKALKLDLAPVRFE